MQKRHLHTYVANFARRAELTKFCSMKNNIVCREGDSFCLWGGGRGFVVSYCKGDVFLGNNRQTEAELLAKMFLY